MTYLSQSIALGKLLRPEKSSPRAEKSSPGHVSPIEEAQALVRRCAEPRPAGDKVGAAILRVARRTTFLFSRTKDLWYGVAARIDAAEMDQLREVAARVEIALALAGIEILRTRLIGSSSPISRDVVAGLDAALQALGRTSPRGRSKWE